ncbi:MAG: SBBP repeat-containing protein [Burkholderiaceae bacterium]
MNEERGFRGDRGGWSSLRRRGPGPWAAALALAVMATTALVWRAASGTGPHAPDSSPRALVAVAQTPVTPAPRRVQEPVRFEPNLGQVPTTVRYLMRAQGLRAAVFDDGLALSHDGARGEATAPVRLSFVGARRAAAIEPHRTSAARTHYLRGSDPAKWLRDVPVYAQLRQNAIYPGVDLVYYSRDGELEYDLVVQPGADPSRIRMKVKGAHAPQLAASGDLLLDGPDGALRLHRPLLYQNIDGRRQQLDGRYVMLAANEVGFELPAYDRTRPLVIDPTFKLLYSTYLTGFHDDRVGGMALDAQGNAYVVGQSNSDDFVVSANAVQTGKTTSGLQYNVVVTKFDASGNLIYSTYLGGTTSDVGAAIAVDAAGNAYIAGNTTSRDFPVTAGAYQPALMGSPSAYLAILSPDGSALRHSTYYGGTGSAQATSIALDASGATVIAGSAGPGLPTTIGAYKNTLASGNAAFVARFSPLAGGAPQLAAASYYGVDNPQANSVAQGNNAYSMALDASGAPWLTGQAFTTNLPLTTAALQAAPGAMSNGCAAGPAPLNSFAYLAKLSADLGSLAYASYLSGQTEPTGGTTCSEFGRAITLDAAGNVYIAGGTGSDKIPTTPGAVQPSTPAGSGFSSYASFLAKLKPDGSALLWSTYFGGNVGQTFLAALALDPGANALWAIGVTGGGSNYPISSDALQKVHGGAGSDVAIAQFDGTSGALKYSSFHGGNAAEDGTAIGVDAGGNVFVAGQTISPNFPVTPDARESAFRPDFFGGADWFFSVLGSGTIGQVRPAAGGNTGEVTLRVTGAGFSAQAACTLAGVDRSLSAAQVVMLDDGRTLVCTFDLTGAAPGSYDLVVGNPDATPITRRAAFTVQAGQGPDLSVEVLGRAVVREAVPSVFDVVVSNSGDVDASGVVLMVRYSKGLRPVDPTLPNPFDFGLIPVPHLAAGDTEDYSSHPIVSGSSLGDGVNLVPLLLPVVSAGQTISLPFRLVAGATADDEYVEAFIVDSFDSATTTRAAGRQLARALATAMSGDRARPSALSSECLDALRALAWEKATGKIPGVDCFRDTDKAIAEMKIYANSHPGNASAFLGDFLGATAKAAASCAELAAVEIAAPIKAALLMQELMENAEKFSDKCKDKDKDKGKNKKKNSKKQTKKKNSTDPNDKSGPVGDGSAAHYLATLPRFAYQIAFENLPTAGLAAADVVITDQLDPTKLDLSTLTLGSISWGNTRIDVPAGLNSYQTVKAIDATMSVRVQGSLNPATGVLKWTFATIDPVTKLPPSDPTIGFLPPDTDGVKGQGYVSFSVMPKPGLANGSTIPNQASIVFDTNAAIATPVWVNTVDTVAPSSRVVAAMQKSGSRDVEVNWTATDAGSGPKSYSVQVSDNGAAFTAWQTDVTTTSAVFSGTSGHSYGFLVIATDAAGNVEGPKADAEATVTVGADTGSGGGGGCTIGDPDQRDASLVLLALAAFVLLWRRRLSVPSRASSPRTAPH